MEKEFSKELKLKAIEILIIGVMIFFIQKYFERRWAPSVAEETLKKENYINAKKEVFFQAIDIVNRYIATTGLYKDNKLMMEPDTTVKRPSYSEIDLCMVKLYVYSKTQDIPKTFRAIVGPKDSINDPIGYSIDLFNLMGKDLSEDFIPIDKYEFKFVFKRPQGDSNFKK